MARIHWKRIDQIRRAHNWTWAVVSHKMGISESHFSELRAGKRPTTLKVVELLCVALDLTWNDALEPVPKPEGEGSARERLGMAYLEDGRPWPTQYNRQIDYEQQRQRTELARKRYIAEREKQERLATWLGGA